MKKEEHISDILNYKLSLIGSKLILRSESNEIGEQIAFLNSGDRCIEIIRLANESKVWIHFQFKGVSIGSFTTKNTDIITQEVQSFLEDQIELIELFNGKSEIKSPINISNLSTEKQILNELIWFDFLQPPSSPDQEPKEWLIIHRTAKVIKKLVYPKGYVPFRSLNRLCISLKADYPENDPSALWISLNKEDTQNLILKDKESNCIFIGNENDFLIELERILK